MHPCFRAVLILSIAFVAGAGFAATDVGGDPEAGKAKAAPCAACHGIDGNGGPDPSFPKLAGQFPEYLVEQLMEYKSGARKDPIMSPMAAPLSEQDMRDLAAFYAGQARKPGAATDKELALAGEKLYRGGVADAGVPACMACHGPAGRGIPPHFPVVYSQQAAYTAKTLLDYKNGRRPDEHDVMTRIAARMSDEQIKAVADYLAGLH